MNDNGIPELRNQSQRTFSVSLSRDVHKYIRQYKKRIEEEKGKRIPFYVAMEEFIRYYGKKAEVETNKIEEETT